MGPALAPLGAVPGGSPRLFVVDVKLPAILAVLVLAVGAAIADAFYASRFRIFELHPWSRGRRTLEVRPPAA
jgi:hypothetical protein